MPRPLNMRTNQKRVLFFLLATWSYSHTPMILTTQVACCAHLFMASVTDIERVNCLDCLRALEAGRQQMVGVPRSELAEEVGESG